jgi:hypothetical protein
MFEERAWLVRVCAGDARSVVPVSPSTRRHDMWCLVYGLGCSYRCIKEGGSSAHRSATYESIGFDRLDSSRSSSREPRGGTDVMQAASAPATPRR